ncbi:hypothetical protein A2V80_02675 [Candidatus Woesebacteria bacterium RBG_16_39_8b]|uniref:CTP synthase (glutamine hydrolyzing) n=1 Tax=Candidatus Woesebacteria bacterium RBG_16_39_8b TaxID=1802482 RepID=A0A1F7X9F8_9BACT|nr:MAG: hypothetical protein A2V80_02675 [Candidatus Woesebacteria bacterium RBG_16_39_8b]
MGIQPDIIVARTSRKIDKKRLLRLALFCNVHPTNIFSAPDLSTIYEVPLLFHKQQHHLASTSLKLLGLKLGKHKYIKEWQSMTKRALKNWKKSVKLAMVGKYFVTGDYKLVDSYVSVVESFRHAAWRLGINIDFDWVDSEEIERRGVEKLKNYQGIIVPQGWGSRGTEGKILTAQYARVNNIPYLGLCFGMQMATIEFARNVLNFRDANTTEVNQNTTHPVIHIMENQKEYLEKNQYGGTIRLGAWPCLLKKDSILDKAYKKHNSEIDAPWWISKTGIKGNILNGKLLIYERHRHRYEFNNKYKSNFEKAGFIISGTSPDKKLVEAIELKNHKFFVGTQYHPEYISRPLTPHPVFLAFLESIID